MSEIQYYVPLEDIVAMEFICKKCQTHLTVSVTRKFPKFPYDCPQCNEPWIDQSDENKIARTVVHILLSMREEASGLQKIGCSLGLKVRPAHIP